MTTDAFEDGDFADDERDILEIILDHSGKATTKELEEETELNSGQIYYRLDKLEGGGWITVQEGSSTQDSPGRPPKEAVLTRRSVDLLDLSELEGAIVVAGGSSADISVIREELDTAHDELTAFQDAVDDIQDSLTDLGDAINAIDDGE